MFISDRPVDITIYDQKAHQELIRLLREKQYYALLSVENVLFNDKEYYQSLAKLNMICEIFGEKPEDMTLKKLGKLKRR